MYNSIIDNEELDYISQTGILPIERDKSNVDLSNHAQVILGSTFIPEPIGAYLLENVNNQTLIKQEQFG